MNAAPPRGLAEGPDGRRRCMWCIGDPEYLRYHDEEWALPVGDDARLYEKLCLEGFQSGLSWLTILRKREGFRRAFADFDPVKVARFGPRDVRRLLSDAAIVRHRGKIESAIQNARRVREVAEEFGSLAAYVWGFEPPPEDRPHTLTWGALAALAETPPSVAFSKDLKRRGFTFVGPTTCYAFMQACGLVNDHLHGCIARARVVRARRSYLRPS